LENEKKQLERSEDALQQKIPRLLRWSKRVWPKLRAMIRDMAKNDANLDIYLCMKTKSEQMVVGAAVLP
jgi:hypothetical protein